MMITSVAVFCGSKNGVHPDYARDAATLGKLIAAKGLKLVYGGGNRGLMGVVANAVLEGNGKVMGIMPKILVDWEQQHEDLSELAIVPDMHTRKKMMYELCDVAVVLPGGFGTLDEFFEMITWNQLKIHDKKIFLLNTNGFYQHLVQHLVQMEQEGFLYEGVSDRVDIKATPEEIVASFE